MHKIKIISVGKTKEEWLQVAFNEYAKRLISVAKIECLWTKDDTHLLALLQKEQTLLVLDPAAKLLTSEGFSKILISSLERGGSRLTFVIGGPEGIPQLLKEKHTLISLSPLTFTHQIVRLILVEQIYRGFEIARGSKYHK